ncbi:MAG: flavin reductase family protein [Anaerolineaceae bacterium]|nr:flavin reductase family protein [Anaerolineaceae bacterium]
MSIDAEAMRHIMRLWATGVTVVTTASGERRHGLTVSSFTSVSVEPALILVCLHKGVEALDIIDESGAFAVSLLSEDQARLSNQFAGVGDLPEGADRFHGVAITTAETGVPILADAIAWMDCTVHAVHDGGTNMIVVGEVVAADRKADAEALPLIYFNRGYRALKL